MSVIAIIFSGINLTLTMSNSINITGVFARDAITPVPELKYLN